MGVRLSAISPSQGSPCCAVELAVQAENTARRMRRMWMCEWWGIQLFVAGEGQCARAAATGIAGGSNERRCGI